MRLFFLIFFFPCLLLAAGTDAGQQSTIIKKSKELPKPFEKNLELEVNPKNTDALKSDSNQTIFITDIIINVSEEIDEISLDHLIEINSNKNMSMNDLLELAQFISAIYQEAGYFLASAYLPPQEIIDGKVTFEVMIGSYDDIKIDGQANVDFNPINITKGDVIKIDDLESGLLLLSDIPGINVKSTITPGASVGTSDLNIIIEPGKKYDLRFDFDNYGSKYTGDERLGATFNLNNPFGLGDVISLQAIDAGHGMDYKKIGYQVPINNYGTKIGFNYSDMGYIVGEEYASLDSKGSAEIKNIYFLQSLIRGRATNLEAQISLDIKDTQDRVESSNEVTNKSIDLINLGLSGDHLDSFFGGGISDFYFTLSLGELSIDSESAKSTDDTSARSDGRFIRYLLNMSRLQKITDDFNVMGQLTFQRTSRNLNSSEKFSGGGPFSVRAYPQGEISADEANQLILEGRYSLFSSTQVKLFLDLLNTKINHDSWSGANSDNYRNLMGYGSEIYWANEYGYSASLVYARRIGAEAITTDRDTDDRFWFQFSKTY